MKSFKRLKPRVRLCLLCMQRTLVIHVRKLHVDNYFFVVANPFISGITDQAQVPAMSNLQQLGPFSQNSTGASPSHSSNPDSPHSVQYIDGSAQLIDGNGLPVDLNSIGPPIEDGTGNPIPLEQVLFGNNYEIVQINNNPEYLSLINLPNADPRSMDGPEREL